MDLFIAALKRDCYSYGVGTFRDFLKLLTALVFLCAAPSLEGRILCLEKLSGDPDLYIYMHESNLDRVIRGEWPWKDSDGFQQMIGRARDFIVSKTNLTQDQNVRLWEAYADRISFHTRGHMKSYKETLSDGTVVFYSGNHQDRTAFYYFFAFPVDGSMHYGRRSADLMPTDRGFNWKNGNESLRQLK